MPSKQLEKLLSEEHPAHVQRDLLPERFEDPTRCGFCHYAKMKAGRAKWRCAKHDIPITWEDGCADHTPADMTS